MNVATADNTVLFITEENHSLQKSGLCKQFFMETNGVVV